MPTTISVGGSASYGSGYSFKDMVEKVYRRVMSGVSEMTVSLGQTIDGSTTANIQMSGTQSAALVPGAIISVDLELMLVLSSNNSSNTVTVERGYMGSIPASHFSGALVYINPSLSKYDIGVAINDDLNSLSANGLVRINTAVITYNPVFMGYDLGDLPTNFIDILELRYKHPFPDRRYPPITRWHVSRYQDTSIFPSGNSLTIYENGFPGMPMYVTYSAPLLPFNSLDDNVCDTSGVNDPDPPYNGYASTASYTFTGTVNLGSQFISVSDTTQFANVRVGQTVSGSGIPTGSFIIAIDFTNKQATMNNYASAAYVDSTFTVRTPTTMPNLPPTAVDIPPLGATIQLIQNREFSRNMYMVQPDPRKAADVPAGSIMNSTQRMEIWRQKRIDEEVARIRKQYTKHPHR